MLEAYAAGVNAFIDSGPLPAELALVDDAPDRWEPWDCLAVFKGRHILMGVFEAKLWRAKLLEALGPEKAAELLPGHRGDLLIVPPAAEYDGAGLRRTAASVRPRRRHRRDARDRLGQQQLGRVRREDGLWQAADGRRPAQGARHAQRLLPEPRRLPRVRRGRPLVPGIPGLPALRTQRQRRVVRHSRRGRLPGRVRRAVQGRPATPLPVRRRVAGGRGTPRGAEGPRRRGRGDRRHRHPSRPGHSRRSEGGLRNRLPLHLHRRPQSDRPVPASDAARRRRRRSRRGDERVGGPVQQLRFHRRPRRHPLPEQGTAARSQHGERVASRAGMVGRVRVARLRAVRRDDPVPQPGHRVHRHGQQQDRGRRLPALHQPLLRLGPPGPPHSRPAAGSHRRDGRGHGGRAPGYRLDPGTYVRVAAQRDRAVRRGREARRGASWRLGTARCTGTW